MSAVLKHVCFFFLFKALFFFCLRMEFSSNKFFDAKIYVVGMCIYFKHVARQFSLLLISRSVLQKKQRDIKGVFDTYEIFPF